MDLIMFENQIPFSVLTKLYYEFFTVHVDLSNYEQKVLLPFLDLSKNFLDINMLSSPDFNENDIQNFTDLQARSWRNIPNNEDSQGTQNTIHLYTATKLDKAGVDFILQSNEDSRSKTDEECLNTKIEVSHLSCWRKFIPWLSTLKLELGLFAIDYNTECLMRNVMAMEQCQEDTSVPTPICDYMYLMDQLIDTEQDVDILVEKKVIKNYLGCSKEVMEMINNLSKNISRSQNFVYHKQCNEVIKFYENWYNHAKATLIRVYFKDIGTGSSTAVGFLIVIFTVISTIEAIWSIKEKNS
ncbi:uncharacterized protein LOC133784569 [Humulus lupulus]|nr:uncharacterized protein LOC133784569 [Humulus lupulus]